MIESYHPFLILTVEASFYNNCKLFEERKRKKRNKMAIFLSTCVNEKNTNYFHLILPHNKNDTLSMTYSFLIIFINVNVFIACSFILSLAASL